MGSKIMEKLYVSENGILREYNEAEYAQAKIDSENYITNVLPNQVRRERNKLMQESDWTQVSDSPVDKEAWATYRQALRDITAQAGFPTDVVWPTKPQA